MDHQSAEQRCLEERTQRRGHAAQHQQGLVVVVIKPSRVEHLGQVGTQSSSYVALLVKSLRRIEKTDEDYVNTHIIAVLSYLPDPVRDRVWRHRREKP